MPLSIPEDYNYATWHGYLSNKVNDACGDNWRFSAPSWTFRDIMFRNLQDGRAAQKLEDYIIGAGTLGSYLGARAGIFFMFIFGVMVLIASIFAALALIPAVRNFYSRIFYGACRSRDRPRLKQIQVKIRHRLVFLILGSGIGSLALVVTQLVASSRIIIDTKRFECGVWLQLYGHFHGTSELSKDTTDPNTRDIAWKWRGTLPLLDALQDINTTTYPRPENPLRMELLTAYDYLKSNVTAEQAAANTTLDRWVALSETWWGVGVDLSTGNTWNGVNGEFVVGTANAVSYKAKVFKQEIQQTLVTGWQTIEALIEKYTGLNSGLLTRATAAAEDAITTVNEMNAVIGALTHKWDHLGPAVVRGLKALAGLSITLEILIFGLIPCYILLTFTLRSRMKSDKLPSKRERALWSYAYVAAAVMTGFSALYCCLCLFLSGVGNDVCDLLEEGLFSRGNWQLLGNDILQPPGVQHIDVVRVLDTCVLSTGRGNVASALAMDARIVEMAQEVDAAQKVVMKSRDTLLDSQDRFLRVKIIKTGAEDIMDFIVRAFVPGVDSAGSTDEDGVEGRLLDTIPGALAPWFNPDWSVEEQSTLLCLIPATASNANALKALVEDCRHYGPTGLQIRPVPLNIGYAAINAVVNDLKAGAQDPNKIFDSYCSDLAAQEGFCSTTSGLILSPDDWTFYPILNGSAGTQLSELQSSLIGGLYTNDPLLGYKAWRTLVTLGRLERFMTTKISETNATSSPYQIDCPSGASDCMLSEAIEETRKITKQRAPQLIHIVESIFALFNQYVDGVTIPTMSRMVDAAYDVLEGVNCQFEGSALQAGAVYPLCQAVFPAVTVTCLIQGLSALLMACVTRQLWKWYRYLDDLAALHNESPVNYDEARASFINMSQRREFVQLYTGVPSPVRSSGITLDVSPEKVEESGTSNMPQALQRVQQQRRVPSYLRQGQETDTVSLALVEGAANSSS